MPKRKLEEETRWFYRRIGSETIYGRDKSGRYTCFQLNQGNVSPLPSGIKKLAPIFNRVDFSNRVRFSGRTRNQRTLTIHFNESPNILTSAWVDLPDSLSHSRRETNQGMNNAMNTLTGEPYSATEYADWYDRQNPRTRINTDLKKWEWCHLRGHAMGGADNETNIVAAVKGNNTEQLAIESALMMYRREYLFAMKISAGLLDNQNGKHIGNVIKYEIKCFYGGCNFVYYLDCLSAPAPSSIHYYGLLNKVASWANTKLVHISEQIYNNGLTASDKYKVIGYMEQHGV